MVASRQESTEVRSLLEAGIADDIGHYDFEKGLSTHLAAVAGPPAGSGGTGMPPAAGPGAPLGAASAPTKALLGWIGAPLVSLTVAAAVVLSRGHAPSPTGGAALHAVPTAVAPAEADQPESEDTPQNSVGGVETQRAHRAASTDEAAGTSRSPAPEKSSKATFPPSRHAAGHADPVVLAEDEPSRAATETSSNNGSGLVRSFPEGDAPVQARGAAPAAPAASPTVDVHRSDDEIERDRRARDETRREADDKLQHEMDELMRAKRALPSDPKLALELAQQGEREFPQSMLAEERKHVLLLALIGLGRTSEAERLATPYLAKHPDSPFAKRVRAALDAAAKRRDTR